MYESIFYDSNGKINGTTIAFRFVPDFRQSVAHYRRGTESKFFTDTGKYTLGKFRDTMGYQNVYALEDAKWFMEEKSPGRAMFSVTEKTEEIVTNWGDDFNREINKLLKEAQRKYSKKKKTELYLYFYDRKKDRLTIISTGISYMTEYKYQLYRHGIEISCIDRKFAKPTQDCFIIGRVKKTIGTKQGKLLDFIEPVHQINLDFERDDEWESIFPEYYESIRRLATELRSLLLFTIQNEYKDNLESKRIKAYILKENLQVAVTTAQEIADFFNNEIKNGFKSGDVAKLRKLYKVLKEEAVV